MDGSLPTHARVVNVAGLPASASKTDSGSAVLPVPRCRRCGFILLSVFFLFLSLFGALYVNLLHAMPDFVDEGGNSTIGLLISLEKGSINMDAAASALPSTIWHAYTLHSAVCTIEGSSEIVKPSMKVLDITADFEQYHVEPNTPTTIKATAVVAPSNVWPEEQARFGLDPRMGIVAAVRSVGDGAPLSWAAVCQFDLSAKLLNLIDTGVMTITQTIALGTDLDDVHPVLDGPRNNGSDPLEIVQKIYTALNFENITNRVLSGKAIEADLDAAIEIFLSEFPLSTPALKGFELRIDSIDVAVGVGSTAVSNDGVPLPPRSEWSLNVGAVHLDLQKSKCVESGTVAVSASVRSNAGESTSVLTPAAHAFTELSSAGSARFALEFKKHQHWFEFLLGKDHVTTAQFNTTSPSDSEENGKYAAAEAAGNSTEAEGGRRGRGRRLLIHTDESGSGAEGEGTCGPYEFECCNGECVSATYVGDGDNDCGDWSDEPHNQRVTKCACKENNPIFVGCASTCNGQIDPSICTEYDPSMCSLGARSLCPVLCDSCTAATTTASSLETPWWGGNYWGEGWSPYVPYLDDTDDLIDYFSDCDSPLETKCFTFNVDDSSVIEACLTAGQCSIGVAGQVAFETIPVHNNGEFTFNYEDPEKITIDAASYNGKGPITNTISGTVTTSFDEAGSLAFTGKAMKNGYEYPVTSGVKWTPNYPKYDDQACVWVKNNYNSVNEQQVDNAASREECIANVRAKCPTATIANYEIGGNECYCQFGIDMRLDSVAEWENCLLTSNDMNGIDLSILCSIDGPDGIAMLIDAKPSINFDKSTLTMPATYNDGELEWKGEVDLQCDHVAGSMYPEKVVHSGLVQQSPAGNFERDTKYCTGTADLVHGGAKAYTLKVSKAGFDLTGDAGGFEFDATGTALGEPIELQALVGWNALYSIQPAYGSYSVGWDTQGQPSCQVDYWGGATAVPCPSVPWMWGGMQNLDLHHKVKYAYNEQNSPALFEFSLDPVIAIEGGTKVTGSVPAKLQVDGEEYAIEASMVCSDGQTDVGCSEVAVKFKQNKKLRASVVLDTVVMDVGANGGIDIKGTAFADSSDNMYKMTEYSVNSDIQWQLVDTAKDHTFTVNPMRADIKQVGASASRSRRGEAGDVVFGLSGQYFMDLDAEGLMNMLDTMKMSMKIEMETSENDEASISFGEIGKISVLDSAPWFGYFISSSQEAVAAGQGFLQVTDWAKIKAGDTMVIGEGSNQETVLVVSVSATGLVVLASALQNAHEAGVAITFEARDSTVVPGTQSGAMSTVPLQLQVLLCVSLMHSLLF